MSIINNSKTDPNKILPMHYKLGARVLQGLASTTTGRPKKSRCRKTSSSGSRIARSRPRTERRLILWNLGLLLDRRVAHRQQHRARGLQPRHQPRGPPIPAAPGLRRGGPYRHLHLLLRHLGARPGRDLQHVQDDPVDRGEGRLRRRDHPERLRPDLHHRGHREHPASSCATWSAST